MSQDIWSLGWNQNLILPVADYRRDIEQCPPMCSLYEAVCLFVKDLCFFSDFLFLQQSVFVICVFAATLLVPAGWILHHIPEYRQRPR